MNVFDQQVQKIGIGFATGRRSFQQVLKTYAYNWMESGVTDQSIKVDVFVAYDLSYNNTTVSDYTDIPPDVLNLFDRVHFIGNHYIKREVAQLIEQGVLSEESARLLFCAGYGGKRNALLFAAIKHGIRSLLFLDDDEYPLAVTRTRAYAIWSGQHVLNTHLEHIRYADITHGHHCGYISPIPQIEFNDTLKEDDFRIFIEAISNDILNWDNIRNVIRNGGVTYADTNVLISEEALSVREHNKAKFISGANLCINLTQPQRVFPFYNPPGARGEDTFLSTLLHERTVLRVPCYTFHDGFSTYQHIMNGVLPTKLKTVRSDEEAVAERFYRACLGWVRYKPLLLYITQHSRYESLIRDMKQKLASTLPKISAYFGKEEFMGIEQELARYHRNVRAHYAQFIKTQAAWADIMRYMNESNRDDIVSEAIV